MVKIVLTDQERKHLIEAILTGRSAAALELEYKRPGVTEEWLHVEIEVGLSPTVGKPAEATVVHVWRVEPSAVLTCYFDAIIEDTGRIYSASLWNLESSRLSRIEHGSIRTSATIRTVIAEIDALLLRMRTHGRPCEPRFFEPALPGTGVGR